MNPTPMAPNEMTWARRATLAATTRAIPTITTILILTAALTLWANTVDAPAGLGTSAILLATATVITLLAFGIKALYTGLRAHLNPVVTVLTITAATAAVGTAVAFALPTCPRMLPGITERCSPPEAASLGVTFGLTILLALLVTTGVAAGANGIGRLLRKRRGKETRPA